MYADKLNKLPKWAQSEFQHLERELASKKRLINQLTGSEAIDYSDLQPGVTYISYRHEVGYRELDSSARILFPSEVGRIEVRGDGGTDVKISSHGGWADFQVRPEVSNVITVRAAARS